MFLANVKTLLVKALTATFDETYPVQQYQGLYVSIEYPEKAAQYPSIWVDFEPSMLEPSGIGPALFTTAPDGDGNVQPYKIWVFEGRCLFTITALSSRERDGIYDELVKIIAFGSLNDGRSVFRDTIDNNAFIPSMMNWDKISTSGQTQVSGTPWGSEEIIYEITVEMGLRGEFASDISNMKLLPLTGVEIFPGIGP